MSFCRPIDKIQACSCQHSATERGPEAPHRRLACQRVDAFVANLPPRGEHINRIVEHVGRNRHPYRTAPQQQIAEIRPEEHAGHKAEKLHMHGAEAECNNPYGHMNIYPACDQQSLEASAE